MAPPTRSQNAEVLKTALGIDIDTTKSDPKATILDGWAGRLETDRAGVQREMLSWKLQDALGVEVTNPGFSAETLQGWLDRAAEEPDAVKDEIAAQSSAGASRPAPGGVPAPARGARTITVRVSDAIAAYGGEFTDPESKETIGKGARAVTLTPFVRGLLRNEEIVED